MANPITFNTPALIRDFPVGSAQDTQLCALWNDNITAFTRQAIVGDPWNETYASNQTSYFDTRVTTIPSTATAALVFWTAFPNRLAQYLGDGASPRNPYSYSPQQLLEIADQYAAPGASIPAFQLIPKNLCPEADWSSDLRMFGPYGPRGWQDEYCEWSVVRDPGSGKITRIDFTCENPEYWNSLWMVDPQKVADVYTSTLNWDRPTDQQVIVKVEDLVLRDPVTKSPVIDPSTGRPAYHPLNKWNSGPIATRPSGGSQAKDATAYYGGAMHLTSTPNTLQTEMQLAGGATIQRPCGNSQAQPLICCAVYGQAYRNSDPHIGQLVNQVVGGQVTGSPCQAALANPTGLYIQVPDLSGFTLPQDPNLPPGATAQDCWQVVRGSVTLTDPVTGYPFGLDANGYGQGGNFVLHAVFQIPSAWVKAGVKFTVGDILDASGNAIQWGGQVVQQMNIGLWARPVPVATVPATQPCVDTSQPNYAQPLQLFHASVWAAFYNTSVPNPMGNPISLASNSTLVPPIVKQGAQGVSMILTCATVTLGSSGQLPTVDLGPGLTAVAQSYNPNINYAVPGNSYPSPCGALALLVSVAADAMPGPRDLMLTNYGDTPQAAMPAMLDVIAS